MKILISGAGIGGLTTALCALEMGHEVTILEQAPEIREVGAGIQLPPNAMKVFANLGLTDALRKTASVPTHIQARMGGSGRKIFTVPLGDLAETIWGAPYLHIHRADYIRVLSAALYDRAPGSLVLGAKVTAYEETGDHVTVELSHGGYLTGNVLIGADGIHSDIRRQMLGDDDPEFTGNVAWRAVVPTTRLGELAPEPTACVWMGQGRHAVTYRLGGGALTNFVGVVERGDWQKESWSEQGEIKDALSDFERFNPVITNLIQNIPDGSLYRWALFDRPPLPRWTEGRVALLGDAAHPMLPFLAQGAAMAVEDSWAVMRELSRDGVKPYQALKAYEGLRFARTKRAQDGSRANMKTFHKRGKVRQLMTYGPMWMAGHVAPSIVRGRLDWLYGYDVTAG